MTEIIIVVLLTCVVLGAMWDRSRCTVKFLERKLDETPEKVSTACYKVLQAVMDETSLPRPVSMRFIKGLRNAGLRESVVEVLLNNRRIYRIEAMRRRHLEHQSRLTTKTSKES